MKAYLLRVEGDDDQGQDDVYYMSDAEAMEILRDYFESGGRK